jgi:putative DNA primase/helicase
MSPLDKVLAAFPDARKAGTGWEAKCPAHDDRHASLCINEGRDSRVLLKCQAGCKYTAVVAAAGLQVADLFARANDLPGRQTGQVVEMYTYADADGTPLFEVHRFEPKAFLQKLPGAAIYGGLNGTKRVPYRLLELTLADADRAVFVVEGERDVNRLMELGLVATCNPGGAGKWRDEYSDYLIGRTVYILPDNDEPGSQHAEQVARSLQGKAREIRIVPLPGLPPKGDVSDWLAAEHSADDLRTVVKAARAWAPRVEAKTVGELPIQTAEEFCSTVPDKPQWLIPGFLARGASTVLSAKIKKGKTTFILAAIRAILQEETFLGLPTVRVGVLYLTEQAGSSFRQALNRAGLTERTDLHVLRWADIAGQSWSEVCDKALRQVRRLGVGLLVVDTLGRFAGIADENDAAAAREAMAPLLQATASGLAVLASMHDRKSGGEVGDSTRGSSQYGGDADIILNLRRLEGNGPANVRLLEALSRYEETPDKLVIELADGRYLSLGTEEEVEAHRMEAAILAALGQGEMDSVALAAALNPAPPGTEPKNKPKLTGTQTRVLAALTAGGQVVKSGDGKSHHPYLYRLQKSVSPLSTQFGETDISLLGDDPIEPVSLLVST